MLTARNIGLLCCGFPAVLAAQSDVAFPPGVYAGRRERLMEQVGGAVVVPGAYLIANGGHDKQDPTFWYLTGVESPYAILVIAPAPGGRRREALFLPDAFQFAGAQYPMADERFRRAAWNLPIRRLSPGPEAQRATGVPETYPLSEFATRLRQLVTSSDTVYVPMGATLFAPPGVATPLSFARQFAESLKALLPGRPLGDVTPVVARMRLIKDPHEIAALRKAAEISAASFREMLTALKPGMNDLEAAGLMEYVWKREGSPRAAFGPIVSSGPSAVSLFTLKSENYNSTDRVMRAGELVFIDYGAAEYATYASDVCRTYPVSDRFTDQQRKYYQIVLEAQEAAIAAVRPGVAMLEVIRAAARVYRAHGLEQFEDVERMGVDRVWGVMPSPTHYLARNGGLTAYSALGSGVRDLGHPIGLEATDSRDYSQPLAAGMVFTIEPKLYIPEQGIAIMIEDMILVTPTGHENLSAAAPKTVEEIEGARRSSPPGAPSPRPPRPPG
jgi:Xaa-Pro aminopeptidase